MAHGVRIEEYTPGRRAEWNRFVEESNNGTLFHNLDFLDYHPAGRFQFRHLLFYKNDALIAVLPGGVSAGAFRSPTGASYGSFATGASLSLQEADQMVKLLKDYCAGMGLAEILLTPPMQVYSRSLHEAVEYALIYNGFGVCNQLYSSVIDLGRIRDRNDLAKTPRYCVGKAERSGVVISEEQRLDTAYGILLKNKEKFRTKPTHSLEDLRRIQSLVPGRLALFQAAFRGQPVAALVLFVTNRTCGLIFYCMHLYEHRKLFSVNYLVEHAIRWCRERGMRYLDYGVSQDTFSANPLDPSWPLVDFKESMGCTGSVRKSFRLSLSRPA